MDALSSNADGRQHWQSALMDNYGTPGLTLVRGEGARVWDADGAEYVDLVGGIAVNALGHAHPDIVAAVTEQITKLGHTSNLYVNPVTVELAEALLDVAGLAAQGKVLFVNSGAEANEAALKISRLTGRTKVVACEGAFHGRTMGSLSLTGQPGKKQPFEPLVPGVVHVPFGDADALRAAVDTDTAAVFLEPILGEGGVIPAPDGYLQAAREITKATGTLLVLDEVQTGIGRTGDWFAFQRAGIVPDLITLAKGLGGGLPLGAVIGVGEAGELLKPGQHGTTFGGNPVCCAAGLAVLRAISRDGLIDHVSRVGKDIAAGVEDMAHPLVKGVRGAGLLIGIMLNEPVSPAVAQAAQAAGYLVNPVAPDTIRLAPPLILSQEQAEGFLAALPGALDTTTTKD
ncbi:MULTISPECIES: acetylornithine transaminase [Amycolatopsis]|uniref:Acetylornithine aminotransferase n=1 Tax=Amycolatopsis thermalba TaxID=944492 RepID=A0ABY4NW29_9PSEU|nr:MULTISPECIES: acetylornithine transaminase [Amycolatopsis]OXM61072.1 aspartate aminotransferase family protein [Amycolatopsis sp. KNN50.9b]UQS24256.1 acetylornithine transaminase [Amycolatopsis thermalba]